MLVHEICFVLNCCFFALIVSLVCKRFMQSLPVDDVFVAQVVQSEGDFTHVVLDCALCKVHVLL